jgi:hypothetical protein
VLGAIRAQASSKAFPRAFQFLRVIGGALDEYGRSHRNLLESRPTPLRTALAMADPHVVTHA